MVGRSSGNFPFRDTVAVSMLRGALDRARAERGISIRSLGRQLGYKQATVLSHMASGRVAIPLERAAEIARAVDIPPAQFLAAAVQQRTAEAADLLGAKEGFVGDDDTGIAFEMRLISGAPLDGLNEDQKSVLREVVADPNPCRRWLTVAELPAVLTLRGLRPKLRSVGLDEADRIKIEAALR